ncbi:MAG: DUF6088 family protein [Flavobacteriaceae bacterium]|nr:DUF6088 family protein [Flavobacteriaceae bacterium]MCY4299688.1 DUF6088 family protein [Flavobacteriaceae bacterium]
MKTTSYVKNRIKKFPKGYVFTYKDFKPKVNNSEAIIKALNRLVTSGKIEKLSKGKYYKPKTTVFGTLDPEQTQVVKDLLQKNGEVIGYLTGASIYNTLGLTTQIPNTIQIGKNDVRPAFTRGRYTISFIKQKNIITRENIFLLQILDVLRNIKKIPDATIQLICKKILERIKNLSSEDQRKLVRLAKKYPPYTRALLGSILETIGNRKLVASLRLTLNPISTYNLPQVNEALSIAESWSIK